MSGYWNGPSDLISPTTVLAALGSGDREQERNFPALSALPFEEDGEVEREDCVLVVFACVDVFFACDEAAEEVDE